MSVNVLNLYEAKGFILNFKGSSQKRGEEYAGECPSCGGEDRFRIWPEQNQGQGSYHCRKCEMFGDAIQFLRDFEGLGFFEAQKAITGKMDFTPKKKIYVQKEELKNKIEIGEAAGTISDLWETKATAFQKYCADLLENFPHVVASLASRGISLESAKHYGIGYCPGENGKPSMMRHRKAWGLDNRPAKADKKEVTVLWLPRGIVVPVVVPILGNITTKRLRIRRDDKDREEYNSKMKYYVVPGSDMTPLFLPSSKGILPANYCVLVVEGELDAYMLHSHIGDFCAVLSIMTAKISSLPEHIMSILNKAALILVATDFGDKSSAGYDGWLKWKETFSKAKRHAPTGANDPGEMFEKGEDVRLWALSGLPSIYAKSILKHAKAEQPQTVSAEKQILTPTQPVIPTTLQALAPKIIYNTAEKESAEHKRFIKQFFSLCGEYIGNFDFIHILECYGITVVPTLDDFIVIGHERWHATDWVKLLHFTRKHAEQIRDQLRARGQLNYEKNKEEILT